MDKKQQDDQGPGPREELRLGVTRRTALRRAGGGVLALSGIGSLLTACGGASSGVASPSSDVGGNAATGSPDIPIASTDHPLTLPLSSSNPAIPPGRSPEKGPLMIYDWADYLSPAVVKSFEQRYGVSAQITNIVTMDEAISKINAGAITPDVWVPDPSRMLELVEANLIQPVNHTYIPNLADVIPAAADPWYDKGARYSTPNFINFYGVAWRNDLLDIHPGSMTNPWDVYWNAPDSTVIGSINADPYTTICMALMREGKSFDRITQDDINTAVSDLKKLKHLKLQYTCFQPMASGVEPLAYAYNGDMIQMPRFLTSATPLSDVSFFFPPDGRGLIVNDMWVIPKNAANPVLAHLFMNHILELDSAIANFRDVGYQTMLKTLTVDKLIAAKVAPPRAIEMAFAPPAFQENGLVVPILTQEQLLWFESGFAALQSG